MRKIKLTIIKGDIIPLMGIVKNYYDSLANENDIQNLMLRENLIQLFNKLFNKNTSLFHKKPDTEFKLNININEAYSFYSMYCDFEESDVYSKVISMNLTDKILRKIL